MGFDLARAAHWTRRTRDFLISVVAVLAMAGALVSGRAREIWIGDSHAVCFNRGFRTANVLRAGRGVFVLHIGSRLMYSVARDGTYPRWVRRLTALASRLRRGTVAMAFCLGEIDVRCHLAKHQCDDGTWDVAFARRYLEQSAAFARAHGFAPVLFVVPPPPCRDQPSLGDLPVVGDFATRASAFAALRAVLAVGAGDVRAGLVDATDLLWDPITGIRPDLTDDHCHVNAAGRRAVRDLVAQQRATRAPHGCASPLV